MSEERKHYSVGEAAKEAGVSEAYIRRLLKLGTITGAKIGRWVWAIPKRELERFMESREKEKP